MWRAQCSIKHHRFAYVVTRRHHPAPVGLGRTLAYIFPVVTHSHECHLFGKKGILGCKRSTVCCGTHHTDTCLQARPCYTPATCLGLLSLRGRCVSVAQSTTREDPPKKTKKINKSGIRSSSVAREPEVSAQLLFP